MELSEVCLERNFYRERLIYLIKNNPILWDKTSIDFTNRSVKQQKWMQVSEELGVPIDKVRRTWENLRDQYRRDLKRQVKHRSKSKWRFYNAMSFIRSMVRIKEASRGNSDSESDYDLHDDDCSNDNASAIQARNLTSASSIASIKNLDPIQFCNVWEQKFNTSEEKNENTFNELTTSGQSKHQLQTPTNKCDLSYESICDSEQIETIQSLDLVKVEIETDYEQEPHQQAQLSSLVSTSAASATSLATKHRSTEIQNDEIVPCKKVHLSRSQQEYEHHDEDYHFVMSILPSLRQVASKRKLPLRVGIMNLISIELDLDQNT